MFGVQREGRFFRADDAAASSSQENLGPGSYSSEKYFAIEKSKPVAAGFGRVERKLESVSGGCDEAAGPGTYDIPSTLLESASNKGVAAFKSRTGRTMEVMKTDAPGPGSYLRQEVDEHRARWGKSRKADWIVRKDSEPSVRWERVPTAPSIPGRKHCYGYDEGAAGELILQEKVDQGHSGSPGDTIGPADYDPKLTSIRTSTRAVDFGKGSGHRFAEAAPDKSALELEEERLRGMPPGARYCHELPSFGEGQSQLERRRDLEGGAATRDGKPRKSAVFRSAVPRMKFMASTHGECAGPGPGEYFQSTTTTTPTASHMKKSVEQHFGSKAPRFGAEPLATPNTEEDNEQWALARSRSSGTISYSPGPGSYLKTMTSWEKRTRRQCTSQGSSNRRLSGKDTERIGFDSTATRFGRLRRMQQVGPGSYDAPSIVDELCKKISSRTGAFGTSTRRFAPDAAVGRHDAASASLPFAAERTLDSTKRSGRESDRRRQKPAAPSSFFASSTSRTSSSALDLPPPGAYYVAIDWTKASGVAKLASGTKDRVPKVQNTATSENIGPGSYNLKSAITKARPGRKKLMLSAASRFPQCSDYQDQHPGPGSYDYQLPFGNLLKPTYNVAIASNCRDLFF